MKQAESFFQYMIKGMFWLFLLVSPVLAYLAGMLYTDVQLRLLNKRVQSLPVYPNARLINRDFIDWNYNGHSWRWELEYETEDDMNEVIAFYQGILPQSGWTFSFNNGESYIYTSDDLTMRLFHDQSKPGNKTFFGLRIHSRYFSTLLDLRYAE
jgi:hypothetical protein